MAGNDLAKLVVRMEAQTAQYQRELEKANGKLDRFEKRQKKSLRNIGRAFKGIGGIVAAAGFATFFRKVTQATRLQEQAVKQLEQGLKTTDQAVGFNLSQLTTYAAELQKVTTFGDEQLIQAQAQLVSFTRIQGDEFKRTLELAADLSVRFGTDLKSSVLQLGKALNDPVANLSALSRSGIQFSKSQKDLIKTLVNSGRQIEAQKVILKELEVQFGGSAKAARDTFGGAIEGLNNAFGDLLESGSGLKGAKEEIEALTKVVGSPATQRAFDLFVSGFVKLASLSAQGLTGLVDQVERVAGFFNGGLAIGDDRIVDDYRENLAKIADLEKRIEQNTTGRTTAMRNQLNVLKAENAELEKKINLAQNLGLNTSGSDGVEFGGVASTGAALPKKKAIPDIEILSPLSGEKEKDASPIVEKFKDDIAAFDEVLQTQQDKLNGFADTSADILTRGFTGGFDGILDGFKQLITQMIMQWVQSGIASLITGGLGGGGGGFFAGLAGFATGGQFMVGGKGGTDANLVAFKATRGERVTVETPAQQQGGGSAVININAIDTQSGVDFIRQNRGAIFSDMMEQWNDSGVAMP